MPAVRRYAEGTKVAVESSRGEITGILAKHGVARMGWMGGPEGDQLMFELHGGQFRLSIDKPTLQEIRRNYPNAYDEQAKLDAEWRRRWRANVLLLKAKPTLQLLLDAHAAGEPSCPRGSGHLTFGYRDRAKAWGILRGEIASCRGPKVEAIAANLLGDLDQVAVDRHVARAATGRDIRQVSPANMRRIADAVRLLATIRGLRPAELQAALWVAGSRQH